MASRERLEGEEARLTSLLSKMLGQWLEKGDYRRVKCMELLFVAGWSNQEAAKELGLTEQQVANFKFDFLARMRTLIKRQGLSQDVFPELYD